MRDFCIELDDAADSLANIGEVLGNAGVNIEGLCFTTIDGRQVVHFVVEDAVTARMMLEKTGIRIKDESAVFVLNKDERRVTGKPGSFGDICRAFADQDIQLKFGYPVENNRFVFGVDDVAKALKMLE